MEASKDVKEEVINFKPRDYPSAFEDLDLIMPDLTADTLETHRRISTASSDEMYAL